MGSVLSDTEKLRRLGEIEERLKEIQREIKLLKQALKRSTVTMKGRLQGLHVDEEEFKMAKKSLFEGE